MDEDAACGCVGTPRRSRPTWQAAAAALARRRRRASSSVTRRSGCGLARCSRQARWPARQTAAGIVAASMARRCQSPLKKSCAVFVPTAGQPHPSRQPSPANVARRHAMRGTARRGTLRSEVSGGGRRPGDTNGEESRSESCPPQRAPHNRTTALPPQRFEDAAPQSNTNAPGNSAMNQKKAARRRLVNHPGKARFTTRAA